MAALAPTFVGTAEDVQRVAEVLCARTHRQPCKAWGQARLLFHHGPTAAAVLATIGPILARQPMAEAPDYLPESWT